MQVGGKAVAGIAVHGKPARRIEQETVLGVQCRKLDSGNRPILVAGQFARVGECHLIGTILLQGGGEDNARGEVGFVAGRGERLAGTVDSFRDDQGVVELKGSVGSGFESNKVNLCDGGDGLRARIDIGFDRVMGYIDARAFCLRRRR